MNIWEEMNKWIKGESEIPIWFLLFVFFIVLMVVSVVVFCLLGLSLSDLRETVDSREMGGTNKDKLIERAFTIIGGIAGGIIAVIGLSAVIRRLRIAEQQVDISQEQVKTSQNQVKNMTDQVKNMESQVESMAAQAKSMEMQAKIAQKGQYSERFTKSVEQLANKDLEICLGGLASLDSLSREKKEEYRRVWEYLGDFLRHHEPLKDEGEKPHPKVNAIAKMLRERKREKYEDFTLDLSKAHLEGADLYSANLRGANLKGAYLKRAHLWFANLERASLDGADLVRTSLWNANLREVDLYSANLRGAKLEEAKLEGALFGGRIKSGEVQDLTALKPEQLRGAFYAEAGSPPKLPAGISDEDKPTAISFDEWFEKKYRQEKEN